MDGFSICQSVRSKFQGPILILTAREDDMDQVVGLEVGADDYVKKPVKPRVLLARIRALLRRFDKTDSTTKSILEENDSDELVNIFINYKFQPTQFDVSKLKELEINISYQAKYINTICAREVSIAKILQILTLPNIAMIEQQPFLVPTLDVSAPAIKARSSIEYSPETAWELGYTGRNTVIAILDTGVDDRHESLENKYIAGYDCTVSVLPERNPDDEDGHGTHCAGNPVLSSGAGCQGKNYHLFHQPVPKSACGHDRRRAQRARRRCAG